MRSQDAIRKAVPGARDVEQEGGTLHEVQIPWRRVHWPAHPGRVGGVPASGDQARQVVRGGRRGAKGLAGGDPVS
ncbi:MAG: hypothetical protein K2Q23_00380, partial [Bryobacteraceae bacterium]|nr:hypothetical protein [Bryobacteraceae bacterium]